MDQVMRTLQDISRKSNTLPYRPNVHTVFKIIINVSLF